jgi:hypothetical protein
MDCDIILETYKIIESIKPISNIRYCKRCNKKMKVIKKDYNKRPCCKKCYFEEIEDRKLKNFFL